MLAATKGAAGINTIVWLFIWKGALAARAAAVGVALIELAAVVIAATLAAVPVPTTAAEASAPQLPAPTVIMFASFTIATWAMMEIGTGRVEIYLDRKQLLPLVVAQLWWSAGQQRKSQRRQSGHRLSAGRLGQQRSEAKSVVFHQDKVGYGSYLLNID